MPEPEVVSFPKLVTDVTRAINPQLLALMESPEGRAVIAKAINEEVEKVRAELAEERKLRTAAEEATSELIVKMEEKTQRRASHDRDFGFHVGADGKTIQPNVSRESSDYLIKLVRALRDKDVTILNELRAQTRAVSTGVPSEGGVLVPTTVASEVFRLLLETGLYPRIARNFPMPVGGSVNIGAVVGKMHAYWVGESVPITDSFPDFDKVVLTAKKLGAYIPVPLELIEDSVIDFGQLVADLIRECMGVEIDRVGIVGSVSNGDPFDGLINSAGINVLTQTGANSDKMSAIDFDVALDMQTTVPEGAETDNSYILSPSYFNWLRKQKDSVGDNIYQKPADGAPATIWNRPYFLTHRMPAFTKASTPSTRTLLYGNWKKFAIFGTRHELSIATSDVAGEAFRNVQIATRGITRIGVTSYGPGIAVLSTSA